MARLTLLAFCLVLLFALDSAISWGNSDVSLETNNNIQDWEDNHITQNLNQIDTIMENNNNLIGSVQANRIYSSHNAYFPYFQPRITTPSTRVTITYKLGKRVSGDRLVSSGTQNQQWTLPQNISQSLIYPRNGVGAIVTYIEVVVEQGSNMGRGFVTGG
ncbi:uncharacterized protein LOC129566535, partial [Sitodiplosis mosellana]|uniref:uncharacterized protein LOC129566535 n=1 Tax=Sitodiplosis mosellana TaxID=263140 RepID=UPI002443B1D9